MCGIWGIFPTDDKGLYVQDTQLMENVMILTSMRGAHSTGVALVGDPKTKPKVAKTIGGPAFLTNTDAWEKITEFALKKARLVFGHGRYATKGAINTKNAHPFVHDHITLVHNGTINYGLADQHKTLETEVDSHALCAAIAEKGLVPALEGIYGAYALIVHDAKEGCVYIVRNEDRPLHRIVTHDKHVLLSEYEACKYMAYKMGLTNPVIEVFPKHLIFKYDIATATWTTDDTLVKLMEKKYQPTSYTPWKSYAGSGGHSKWEKPAKQHEATVYSSIDLMLTRIEAIEGTKQYKYFLYDDAGLEYVALSAHNYPERVGEIAKIQKHVKMENRVTGEITRFVRFRELDWQLTPEPEEKKEPENPKPEAVQTYNNYILKYDQWLSYLKKEDCAVCGGPIHEHEAENTILTPSKTLICGDCIHQGKHYAFGYGQ